MIAASLHRQLLSGAGLEPEALEKPAALPTSVLLPLLGQHFGHEVGASCDGQAGFRNLGMSATHAECPSCRDLCAGRDLNRLLRIQSSEVDALLLKEEL